jgi:isoaspartyl peptidase/L-asparaginase-like protein (Ntn-hydrolase superfamily)
MSLHSKLQNQNHPWLIVLIKDQVLKSHHHYKQKLDRLHETVAGNLRDSAAAEAACREKLFNREEIKKLNESHPLDTVGAIVMDRNGNMASAVSSGGILLKHPGRVGHASMFGCGCWVDENIQFVEDGGYENHSIAICTTGCGEFILKTLLARECASYMCRHRDKIGYNLNEFFKKKFFST